VGVGVVERGQNFAGLFESLAVGRSDGSEMAVEDDVDVRFLYVARA